MMPVKKTHSQSGVSLLEVILVLAIVSMLLVLGLRMYLSLRAGQDLRQVQYNVDALFLGLTNYYRANCRQYKNISGTVTKAGTLDPDAVTPPTMPNFPIQDIDTNLFKPGYLAKWPFSPNQYVDSTSSGNGYVVQFNLALDSSTSSEPQRMNNGMSVGSIYIWKAQVAVKMYNADVYQKELAADCVSSYDSGTKTVFPCANKTGGDYVVWERLPTFSAPSTMTELWPTLPTLEQFNQMYTTYPITTITNGWVTDQNYLCNG